MKRSIGGPNTGFLNKFPKGPECGFLTIFRGSNNLFFIIIGGPNKKNISRVQMGFPHVDF